MNCAHCCSSGEAACIRVEHLDAARICCCKIRAPETVCPLLFWTKPLPDHIVLSVPAVKVAFRVFVICWLAEATALSS